jgi:peptidoglycan/LPS O-acetylase OafA/YrhL
MKQLNGNDLSSGESFLMDIVRFLAALWVMLMHGYAIWFPSNSQKAFHFGHAAVIIFFVLSGYVISYTSIKKNRGLKEYFVARFSRLYSILIPSLLITSGIEIYIFNFYPLYYHEINRGWPLLRYIFSGVFINEIWFFSSAPPLNAPLWSLSFEFWYYVVYAFIFFVRPLKVSIALTLIAIFIAGPKILSMMPIWLLGVWAYRFKKMDIPKWSALTISVINFLIAGILIVFMRSLPYKLGTPPWFFASSFISDFIIGLFFALGFYFFPALSFESKNWIGYFRKIANLTFPIYLLHNPFFNLMKCVISFKANSYSQYILVFFILLIIVSILGFVMENYKKNWTGFFKTLFNHRIFEIPGKKKNEPQSVILIDSGDTGLVKK